jgi:FtsP/CotA-like multicopper oxidase with cupredoxin domain
LEKPETKPYLMLAPGERLDVWADFSGRSEGSQLVMRSLAFSGVLPQMAEHMMGGGMGGMGMGGMMHGNALPLGSEYPIFSLRVTRKVSDSPKLPTQLSKIARYSLSDTANPKQPIPLAISEGPMAMLLNGRPFAYDDVQPYERVPVDSVQLLEIFHAHDGRGGHAMDATKNNQPSMSDDTPMMQHGGMGMGRMGGMGMRHGMRDHADGNQQDGMMGMGGMGMMMAMAHPIHLHGQSFQIISRSINTEGGNSSNYATVKEGFIDSGLKDTVLVMPGETVRIIKPFQDFKGLFLYHCHNLEHEDMGMMRYFSVE